MRTSLLAGKTRLKHPRHKFFSLQSSCLPGMAFFKEIQESLVMGYAKDIVDDDGFLLFYDFYG